MLSGFDNRECRMNKGKTLSAQVIEFVPSKTFGRIIERHKGDASVRTLGCADLFRSTQAAIKLHTLLDLRGAIPAFIHISDGKLRDCQRARHSSCRGGQFLYHGPRIPGLRAAVRDATDQPDFANQLNLFDI
jgi:hypothetical protein